MRLPFLSARASGHGFAPLPQRYPPLVWRKPAVIWAPVALALGVGWPFWAFGGQGPLALAALAVTGAGAAAGLAALTLATMFRRGPRTRRSAALVVGLCIFFAAAASPLLLDTLLEQAARQAERPIGEGLSVSAAFAALPLTLMVAAPCALFCGFTVSLVAFVKAPRREWGEAIAMLAPRPEFVVVTDEPASPGVAALAALEPDAQRRESGRASA